MPTTCVNNTPCLVVGTYLHITNKNMIKETVNEYRFRDVLMSDEYAKWSYGAVTALYEYYEQLSEDIGEDIELDRVAIRCEWNEYDNALECASNYDYMVDHYQNLLSESENDALAREWLEDNTNVLDVENQQLDDSSPHAPYRTVKSILVREF